MRTLVYLASPYSHPDPAVREARFRAACQATAHLMRSGLHVFSPIAHTHPVALAGSLPGNWEYWESYVEAVLQSCLALAVLKLDGWRVSRGIRGEEEIADRLHLARYYTSPDPASLDLLTRVIRRDIQDKTSPPFETWNS